MRLIRKRPARSDARPHRWRGPGRGRLGIALSFLVVFFSVLALAGGGSVVAVAGPGPSWWMVDTHEHSAFSGDARADIGIDAQIDKNLGYNAVFLTDHDRMSSF